MESVNKKNRTETVQNLDNASKDVLSLIFIDVSIKDLCSLRVVCKGPIHQAATEALRRLKTRELRPLFPELFAALGAEKKILDLETLRAIHFYLRSGNNARERFEATKDNENVSVLLRDFPKGFGQLEIQSQPLIESVKEGNFDAVKQQLGKEFSLGQSPYGTPDLLYSFSWANAADANGKTPLHWAAGNNNIELVKLLLEKGANIHATYKSTLNKCYLPCLRGRTALDKAAYEGHVEMVKLLLEHGADVNAVAGDDISPICLAEQYTSTVLCDEKRSKNCADIVDLLLNNGASGRDAFYSALKHNYPLMAKTLIESRTDIDLAEAFFDAVEYGRFELVKTLLEYDIDINATYDYGGDLDVNFYKGWTPLHMTAIDTCPLFTRDFEEDKQADMMEMFLKRGAKIEAVNPAGRTALHLTAHAQLPDRMKILLRYGANVNVVDDEDNTPLLAAANPNPQLAGDLWEWEEEDEDRYAEILTMLIEHGADIEAVDRDGKNARFYVEQHSSQEELLKIIDKKQAETDRLKKSIK